MATAAAPPGTAGPAWPLIGHLAAETAFADAVASGRLHHAWLLEGPSGIGKSRLARRMAGYLLKDEAASGTDPSGAANPAGPDKGHRPLDIPLGDPAVRLMEAGAHPDLRWIERAADDKGKLAQDIKVDQVRALIQFFTLAPARGGWRVGVIDALDEVNRSGANAVLKTLEEPPDRSILILLYHGRTPILPTVRSRCRRLHLGPLSDPEARAVLEAEGHDTPDKLVRMAKGRPGQALALSTPQGAAATASAAAILKSLPRPSAATLSEAIAAASASDEAFDAFSSHILSWLADRAADKPELASQWLSLSQTLSEAREDKMDKAQTAAKLVAGLQKPPSPY